MTRFTGPLCALAAVCALLGCASQLPASGSGLSGVSVAAYPVVRVDEGGNPMIDQALVRRLTEAGFVVAADGQDADARVHYEDRLDDGFVLLLKIDFRDAETNVLLATGQAYVPPLKRRPEVLIVGEVLDALLEAPAP